MTNSPAYGKTTGQIDNLRDAEFDVFLSHAATDAELVDAAAARIAAVGIRIYVDRVDDTELDRNAVTRETAQRLRQRMRRCRVLVLAVTRHSAASRWIPWELGYFDGHAGEVFVYPLDTATQEYGTGQEYLDLYERLEPSRAPEALAQRLVELRGALFRQADHRATADYGQQIGQRLPHLAGDPSAALRMQSEIADAWFRLYQAWWDGVLRSGRTRPR
jgi:hypothetical protein